MYVLLPIWIRIKLTYFFYLFKKLFEKFKTHSHIIKATLL